MTTITTTIWSKTTAGRPPWWRGSFGCRSVARGFTLVELLVVIAIIGVLISLLLPAVQSTRESSRRIACANQVRQFAFAIQQHVTLFDALPCGALNKNTSAGSPPSLYDLRTPDTWFAVILPFMEQHAVHDALDFGQGTGAAVNRDVVARALPGVMCPSDGEGNATSVVEQRCDLFTYPVTNRMVGLWYAASLGNAPLWGRCAFCAPTSPTAANAACCAGADRGIDGNPPGMFALSRTRIRLATVTDGLSKTILLGETLPREHQHNGAYTGHYPIVATNIPINSYVPRDQWPKPGQHVSNWSEAAGIKSRHPGGAHVALADGAIVFLADTLRFDVLLEMGTRRSGMVLPAL